MREDQVENGVKFLVHPKVKTAPLSQRISFLENKGLTPEEISVALSRVEGQGGGDGSTPSSTGDEAAEAHLASAGNSNGGAFASRPLPFAAAEASVPLWRKIAVPGALALGAVGALGTYHMASRPTGGSSRDADSSQAAGMPYSSAAPGTTSDGLSGAELATQGGTNNTTGEGGVALDYAQDGFPPPSHRLEPGAAYPPYDGGGGGANLPPRNGGAEEMPGAGEASSLLAGEFRRLTETMEQQTGHLVEAVGAMKSLASRAEQDSSSLLAARVSSHTSELRAELDTIKQLLLLQAGGEGGGRAGRALSGAAGAVASMSACRAVGTSPNDHDNDTTGVDRDKSKGLEKDSPKASGGVGGAGEATGTGGPPMDDRDKEKKAKEDEEAAKAIVVAATARRKVAARTALAAMLADNAPQAAKDGIAMLRMLVANLVKHPNVPRYRRIATSNDNFKKRLLPLEGHRAMMEAIGFKSKGSLWEWTWHDDSGPSASSSNKAVLEDIVAAIDAVARPNGPPLPTSPPATPAIALSSAATSTPPATAIAPNGSNGSAAVWPKANGDAHNSPPPPAVDAAGGGATRDVGGKSTDSGDGVAQDSATRRGVLAAASEVNGVGKGAGEGGLPSELAPTATAVAAEAAQAASGELPAASALQGAAPARTEEGGREAGPVGGGENAPPTSMAEVAAAVQRGEEPPGIKIVEDRLSADAVAFAPTSQPSPPKPWEVALGAGASEVRPPAPSSGDGSAGVSAGSGGVHGYRNGDDGRSLPQHAVSVGP